MRIFGVDISLTGTGLCIAKDSKIVDTFCVTSKPSKTPMARYTGIGKAIREFLSPEPGDIVFMEGYAYGAKGHVFDIAECTGIIKYQFYHLGEGLRYVIVPPTLLKKYLTGKGVAPKDIMIKEVYKQYGFDTNNNNIADAVALAMLGSYMMATPFEAMPKYKQELMKALQKNNEEVYEDVKKSHATQAGPGNATGRRELNCGSGNIA